LDRSYANDAIRAGTAPQQEPWETTDLVRRLCHALDIARQTVGLLATDGFINPDDPGNKIVPEKIIGETAFLLVAAQAAKAYPEVGERIAAAAMLLIPHARNKKILLKICLHPALAMEYAQAHACLKNIGYPDGRFDAVLLKSLSARCHAGRERTPHRMLEQAWIKKTGGYVTPPAGWIAKTIADTVLAQPLDLLHGTRDDLYAFTHALMYVSGFNVAPWPMPRGREAIITEAQGMLARCLHEQDYDLAGEVLLTWPLTGHSWNAAAVFAFRILAGVEDQAGFLPSPATRVDTMGQLQGDARRKYLFATAYHTAYVMGLLCSAALQPGRGPFKNIFTDNAIPGSAARILLFFGDDITASHWYGEFARLDLPEQDAVAPLLLDMALITHTKQCRYQQVHELLQAAYELHMPQSAAMAQAGELLERLILVSSS
jgi:hypothetical protein